MKPATRSTQNPTLAQVPQQPQMCDALDVEAQSAPCERPNMSSSCDALVMPACTSSDDAACATTSDFEDEAPFSIRGYAAAVREINISKCWPFSRQLLDESIQEGKHPLLPPIFPCACEVKVNPDLYQDGSGDSTQEDMGANDGPHLQVQIDLSKCDAEIDSHACATATCAPPKPVNPSLETTQSQELQEPSTLLLREDAAKGDSLFRECPLVFKRQAPRSIREIRNSVMQGCQCIKVMGIAEACKKGSCSKVSGISPTVDNRPSSLEALNEHSHDGQLGGLNRKGSEEHDNVSGVTQLDFSREGPHDSQDVTCLQAGSNLPVEEMSKDMNFTNEQSVMLAVSGPPTSQMNVYENAFLGKDIHVYTRGDIMHRRCLVSNLQSIDKSPSSHNLRSTHSRQCWDMTTQQELPDSVACLDNVPQQRCPICLLFQSSSNTALNVHIDRCLAASSMEEGIIKSRQKVRVRKKRSIAELCLIAPSSIVNCENPVESTVSDCNIKSQKPLTKAVVETKNLTVRKHNEASEPEAKGNSLKLLQWGSKSSSRHGASRRSSIQKARTGRMKRQNFQNKTLEWRTSSMLRNTRKWKCQKTNHEGVAEEPKNAQPALTLNQESAKKLRKLIQKDKEVPSRVIGKDANKRECSAESLIRKLSSKLHGRVLSKRKTAALRAVLQLTEKRYSKIVKKASHVPTLDAHSNVVYSHETCVEVVHSDNVVHADIDNGHKTQEEVQLHELVHSTKKRKKKGKQKTGADFQEALDLQLAIIRAPSDSHRVCNAEAVGPDSPVEEPPMQEPLGIAEESLEPDMLRQPNPLQRKICHAGDSKRIAEEQSIQDSSLPLLSAMMHSYQGDRRMPLDCRKAQVSSTQSSTPCLTCTDSHPSTSGISACFRGANDIDMTLLPLGAQPNSKTASRKNFDALLFQQKEMDQIQVSDPQRAEISLLSTMPPNRNNVSVQQDGQYSFPLSLTGPPWQPRQFERQNLTVGSSKGVHSSVPFHFQNSLEVANRTLTTSSTSQGSGARQESLRQDNCINHTGRQISSLQKHADSHLQDDPGSTQRIFHRDMGSTKIPPFPGSLIDDTCQNRSQTLPPWMEAAIHDQRLPAFSSISFPTDSSCQSLLSNTPSSISPGVSRTLSVLEMIGSPVLRLMGKTVVLMPDASSGHVDINTGQLGRQSIDKKSFQSLEPEEGTYDAPNQLNQRPLQNFQSQSGTQPEYPASNEPICSRREVQSWATSESRPIPELQDFFSRMPLSSQIPSTLQPTNSPNIPMHIATQNQPMHSQLLSAMSYRAQLNWQHQKAAKSPLCWPQSSLCCPHNQGWTNLGFSGDGSERSGFQATPTAPQAPHNSTYNTNNINAANFSNLSSWFGGTVNTGVKTSRQNGNVIILDEESPLCSFNMSTSGPPVQGMATHPKHSKVSAAQQNGTPAECRENLPDPCRPARERPKDTTFIPIIYTVGGNSVAPPSIPAVTGPNTSSSVTTAHLQRQASSHRAAINPPRKRGSCVGQPRDGAKRMKTGEKVSPNPNVGTGSFHHGKTCSLVSFEPTNCTAELPMSASMNGLCEASDEQMENTALNGSVSKRQPRRNPLCVQPEQNAMQGRQDLKVMKEKRPDAPAIGMCSINMNPAEVDCQDAGQFTVTPAIDIPPEPSPMDNAQVCLDTNVSMGSHHPASTQKAKWPLSSSTTSTPSPSVMPSSTSHPIQNAVLQTLHKKLASKLKSSLPVIYDSSRPPSFLVTIPMVNQPYPLLPDAMAPAFVSSANQPGLQASASSQETHPFKAARKFVIVNGRVSIMDTQRNKGMIPENVMQQGRQPAHTHAMSGQRDGTFIHSNQTDNGGRRPNQEYVADAMRQAAWGTGPKVLGVGKSSARGGSHVRHKVAATTLEK